MVRKSFTRSVPSAIGGVDGHSMHNQILLGLPRKECRVVFANLDFVEIRTHDALQEAGTPIAHGYFLNSGVASFLNVMRDGKNVEVGLAGKEGFNRLAVSSWFENEFHPSRGAGFAPMSAIADTAKSLRASHDDASRASCAL